MTTKPLRTSLTAAAAASLLVLSACANGTSTASDGGKIKIGFVVHVLGDPFVQQIIDGAKAAAKENNVDLHVTGPASGDADQQMQQIHNLVASGAQGIATSVPNASMVSQLNQIVDGGVPVVQFNLLGAKVNAPYVGERSTESGRILARQVLSQIGGPKAKGKVIVGNCFPGDPSLDARGKGVVSTLHSTAPGLSVKGPYDVKVAANQNYSAWESLLSANRDAKALIGLCAPDVTSLGKLKAANPGSAFVAGGYDLTAQNLQQVQAGRAYVSLGQSPFVQGYLPVKMLADSLRKHQDLSKGGFINAGTEIVTKTKATEPNGLPATTFAQIQHNSTSAAATRKFYQPLVDTYLKNWQKELQPISTEWK